MPDNKKNDSSLKQAFIATLCKHPKASDYQQDAFRSADIMGLYKKLKEAGETLNKSDFLGTDKSGEYFLGSARAWDNFHHIVEILRENGEEFTADDFLTVKEGSYYQRPLIESVVSHDKVDKLFSADVWKGRFEEMENLWYYIPPNKRGQLAQDEDGRIPLKLKREVLGLDEQTPLREESLKKIGIDYKAVPDMFSKRGTFDAFLQTLYENNTPLKKEDLLFVNKDGDTMFHNAAAWQYYDKIVDSLQQSGQSFGIEELTFKRGRKPSILERAAQHKMLHKVFEPRFWIGQVDEMVGLWDNLPPAQKVLTGRNSFDTIVADVENMTYRSYVSLNEDMTSASLTAPIVANDGKQSKVLPIGLRDTWDNMDIVREKLQAKNDDLKVAHLRQTSGALENTVLMAAAEAGQFDKVLDIVRSDSDTLQVQDFLKPNKNGVSLLDVLIEKRQLKKAFAPEIWAGRLREMHILWNNVQNRDRGQVDFQKVVSQVNQMTVRQKLRRPGRKM